MKRAAALMAAWGVFDEGGVTMPVAICPYCQHKNFDDEFPGEDRGTEITCESCECEFIAIGVVRTAYKSRCADSRHIWVNVDAATPYMRCMKCDATLRKT